MRPSRMLVWLHIQLLFRLGENDAAKKKKVSSGFRYSFSSAKSSKSCVRCVCEWCCSSTPLETKSLLRKRSHRWTTYTVTHMYALSISLATCRKDSRSLNVKKSMCWNWSEKNYIWAVNSIQAMILFLISLFFCSLIIKSRIALSMMNIKKQLNLSLHPRNRPAKQKWRRKRIIGLWNLN